MTEAVAEDKDLTSEVSSDITATLRVLNWGMLQKKQLQMRQLQDLMKNILM